MEQGNLVEGKLSTGYCGTIAPKWQGGTSGPGFCLEIGRTVLCGNTPINPLMPRITKAGLMESQLALYRSQGLTILHARSDKIVQRDAKNRPTGRIFSYNLGNTLS